MPFLRLADVRLHYRVVEGPTDRPWLVFLHEGLGSVELWREFPDRVAHDSGHPALIYSRKGHGWSTPLNGPRGTDFMHREALEVLPAVLARMSITDPILIGHSDGASIALIHAARRSVLGVVALAPHVFVEKESLSGIRRAGRAFAETDLAQRMAKYHHDPVSTFRGWHDAWVAPEFQSWNIESFIGEIRAPLLLVQGSDDEYGTEAQIRAIEGAAAGPVSRLWLDDCGHSPHLDRPDETGNAVVGFLQRLQGDPESHD